MNVSLNFLEDTQSVLVKFAGLDPSIQVSHALAFLFVARHHEHPNGCTTRAMGQELNLTPVSASRITYYWANKGYLTVAIDPADKRRRLVSLTSKGKCLLADLLKDIPT
jgi:DNA-binding MarR family transcriptional regulator